MLKTNQGEIQDGKSNKLYFEAEGQECQPMRGLGTDCETNQRRRVNQNLDVSSDGKMSVDFPVCHCHREIWRGSEIPHEIKNQDAANRDAAHQTVGEKKMRIIRE